MNFYSWDEINDEIQIEEDQKEYRKRSDEVGFQLVELLPNGVVVTKTDRHFGLECWAKDEDEAHEKFSEFPYFNDFTWER